MKSDSDFAQAVKSVLVNPTYQARLAAAIEVAHVWLTKQVD